MLELTFGSVGAQRVRFAVVPAEETLGAVRAAAMPDRAPLHRAWASTAHATLAGLDAAELVATITGRDYFPDFLSPPPAGQDTTLAQQLDRLRETPADQVATELALAFAGRRLPNRLVGDPAAARDLLAQQIERCWQALLEPIWTRVADVLAADIAHRARQYAAGGLAAVLADLHPAVSHRPGAVTVRSRHRAHIELDERGLILAPRAINWPEVGVMMLPPWPPMLVYPARGAATVWEGPAEPPPDLAGVVGRAKARLLAELVEPANTAALARRLGLAAGTVSEHLRALRAAGLVGSRRVGRVVEYEITGLGRALVEGVDPR
ncbi:helix-turn-helix transcriptional regulator [Solihabitans fulvus]|uniref:Helix-turn-helix transcriptional regulator n=1 Tax=Solihabitans fulvus TaxID=1892852 RepID=A0A5B2WNN0_9PSEU|nr:DUF5937 family protein [Solihabitans fulvus]KAA2252400.1 helix-turn-helix transcriptional regulator [Solihabitans fulvus]